ncbi:hypothetical protein T06_7236 [Trichinella sp. T6]|nr:hypothetical protein T06_7236 [Trichinella sp. T6]
MKHVNIIFYSVLCVKKDNTSLEFQKGGGCGWSFKSFKQHFKQRIKMREITSESNIPIQFSLLSKSIEFHLNNKFI